MVRRELPGTIVPVILSFDGPYTVRLVDEAEARRLDSFLAGLHDRSTIVSGGRVERCVQIDFTPLGFHRLFGVPMDELVNQSLDLGELLGPAAAALSERLYAAANWGDRFALLDEVLMARMRRAAPVSTEVAWAWSRLERTSGRARIGDLTGQLAWSRKRLVSAFRTEIGLPPKTVARLFRFDHARDLLAAGDPAISVAEAAGYSDQAHMIRDFVDLSGVTPAGINDELDGPGEQIFNPGRD